MPFTYLALGDSYTIGEQVSLYESFPYQLVQLLRMSAIDFLAPEIIAKTGWTTNELLSQMEQTHFLKNYDWATLLIGVNNQYRGRSVENYQQEFTDLIQMAIGLCGNKPGQVIVLSIPDWGTTPFAKEKDTKKISYEVDDYNKTCKQITENAGCKFINITNAQRADASRPEFVAADGLHPSEKEYAKWANKLYAYIFSMVK